MTSHSGPRSLPSALSVLRAGAAVFVLLGLGIAGTAPANAAAPIPAPADQAACVVQLSANGTGAALTKTVTDVTNNGDGTWTIDYNFESTRPDGTYDFRDCAFVDANFDSNYDVGEVVVAASPSTSINLVGGEGSGAVTIDADEGDSVCDRVVLSGTGPPNFTHRSNIACTDLDGGVQIPAGAIGGVGLAVIVAAGLGIALLRRRPSTA